MKFSKKALSFCLVIFTLVLQVPSNACVLALCDTDVRYELKLSQPNMAKTSLKNGVLTVNLSENDLFEDYINSDGIDLAEVSSIIVHGFFSEKNAGYIKDKFSYCCPEDAPTHSCTDLEDCTCRDNTDKSLRLDLIDLRNAELDEDISLSFFDGIDGDTVVIFPEKLTSRHTHSGFILKEIFYSIDKGKASLFEHVKSGTKFLLLNNNEDTKEFSITFRTIPSDDTGINHILEHCLVASSTKHQSDSVLHSMCAQFSNSMVNACTADKFTSYVQASEDKNELVEMAKITTNCVFCPSVIYDKRFFEREGIRYQLNCKDDPITVNGIVYHEMERNYSPIWDSIKKQLFANSHFRWYTGGNPLHILDATHENLKNTYNRFYMPSNSLFFLSGNFDEDEIDNFFSWLNCEHLNNYECVPVSPADIRSKDDICPTEKYKEVSFIGKEKREFLHEIISVSYIVQNDHRLSPICSLLSSELEKMGYTFPDTFCSETGNVAVFVVSVNPKDKEYFTIELLKSDIDIAFKNILTSEDLEKQFAEYTAGNFSNFDSSLNFFEVSQDFSNDRMFECLKSKNKYQKPVSKDDICTFVENNFLGNEKFAITKFIPDCSPGQYRQEIVSKLDEYKHRLTELEISALIKNTKDFDSWVEQNYFLSLRDLQKSGVLSKIKLDASRNEVAVYEKISGKRSKWVEDSACKTVSLGFSSLRVPEKKLMFLTLLAQLAQLTPDFFEGADNEFIPVWNLSLFGEENIDEPLKCVESIFAEDYDYKKEIKKALFSQESYDTSSDSCEVYKAFCKFFAYKDFLYSNDYFNFVKFVLDNIDDENFLQFVKNELMAVRDLLFCNNNIEKITFSSSSEEKLALVEKLAQFVENLPNSIEPKYSAKINIPTVGTRAVDKGETMSENSVVACVGLSEDYDIPADELSVLAAVIKNNYLIPKIRLNGGTYDVQFFWDESISAFTMTTFQDASVMDSVGAFRDIPNFVKNTEFNQNDIDTAVFSVLNSCINEPKTIFGSCTQEELDQKVDRIKSFSVEKLKSYVPMLEDIFKKCNIVVNADSDTIARNKTAFDFIKSSKAGKTCTFSVAA